MDVQEAMQQSLALVNQSEIVLVGSNGEDGYPWIKAMIRAESQGLKHIWFSTNTSSRRVGQFGRDPKASIYFVDWVKWKGLMLVGEMEILQYQESRQRLWKDGDERYYPLGVTDPDYSVLHFTARWGNFYYALSNVNFDID